MGTRENKLAFPNEVATIVAIDDQEINLESMRQVLGPSYRLVCELDGERGYTACVSERPELILLDVRMPDIDGVALARKLKQDQRTAHIPIIFITSCVDSGEESACWEAGAVDFVSKPFNPATLLRRVQVHLTLSRQQAALRQIAYLDGLTGIPNRRYFDEQAETELARARRSGTDLTLMLIDVDFFKRYNDTYGHQAGDACLQSVANALKQTLRRPGDFVARYGGEEFAILLPGMAATAASAMGERLCEAVRGLHLPHAESDVAPIVTVSIGVAAHDARAGLGLDRLLGAADQQLYLAKGAGRNRFQVA